MLAGERLQLSAGLVPAFEAKRISKDAFKAGLQFGFVPESASLYHPDVLLQDVVRALTFTGACSMLAGC